MSSGPLRLLCPDCSATLRQEHSKMNIELDLCADHGVFLDTRDLRALVSEDTMATIREIAQGSTLRGGPCPHCREPLRQAQLNQVVGHACTSCGGLWFRNQDLQSHVHAVRTRAYGQGSMVARPDVMWDATPFYAPETVAGILTDFELEHEL